ncbi:arginine--tRNA ligase [Thermosediminibacter oceani]|uniref:Arginine--tRNA ligase n=1 Tax=Thermosediminibacter oceani (strain ATCC BAA-1034 / DSM 16646 / JW/IW-1228P) TaxID=555079 RepID=D9S0N8_THEOJ|nr:arginine--tRNA ligase [Thermosediminibacter oceani]ADL08896.1 arginyl-tRNA synthetase [Thermosediminibacter oceani DSM 16646]
MKDVKAQIQDKLKELTVSALKKAVDDGVINLTKIPEFNIEVPQAEAHGDFAANVAMTAAREAKMPPRKIAEIIKERMEISGTGIERIEVAGSGFINFYLSPTWAHGVIPVILSEGDAYGRQDIGKGKKVQVEFVSANPTGPMHMGNARGAALGDALASVLEMAGYDVTREFYINDAGNQIENFGLSLEARYLELLGLEGRIPEGGYHGEDIKDHMRELIEKEGDRFLHVDPAERRAYFIEYALKKNIDRMKRDLENFGVHFDVWFSERSLHDEGKVQEVIRLLTERGYTYEKDGALWFKATEFGVPKDEVLVRQNGIPTYFASDIAYHKDKFDRGFEWVIDIWGADHHGHVARMKGALAALGYDPEKLTIIIMQLVRLYRNGEIARMSKRTGRAVTLADLVEEVGKDAARFFFNLRGADTHLDFDLDLAVKQSEENPVYYVQYAHARISSIFRQAAEQGVAVPEVRDRSPEDLEKLLSKLTDETEIQLIKKLADFPGEIRVAASTLSPYRIANYTLELAAAFHSFYNVCRVLTDDPDLTAARLMLVKAVQQVLRNAFRILGISAPDRM